MSAPVITDITYLQRHFCLDYMVHSYHLQKDLFRGTTHCHPVSKIVYVDVQA